MVEGYDDDSELDDELFAVDDKNTRDAVVALRKWFTEHPKEVFYSRQLEILHERDYFHWITNRAIKQLEGDGFILSDKGGAGLPNVLYLSSHRYPKRQIKRLRELIDEYRDDEITHQIGDHCEMLVEIAFGRAGFKFLGKDVNELDGLRWTETNHDLDYVFERDGIRYGVEIKNQLGYTNLRNELPLKARLARSIGCVPVFVSRWLPKNWIWDYLIRDKQSHQGFALLFREQMQHPSHADLARRMQNDLLLPVSVVRAFPDGDMLRFIKWHEKQVLKRSSSA